MGWGGMDCTDLTQDRGEWRAHMYTVVMLRVPYNVAKFLSS
jgi:hypothetical protein